MTATPARPELGFTDGPLSRRSMLTVCTAAGLTSLYGAYAKCITPWFRPGSLVEQGLAKIGSIAPPPPPENVRMAELYLSTQPWAAKAKYQVRTAEAFVYANEWEPVENDQAVRFRPFAMIYMPEGRPADEQPVTVVGESAYLKFAKRFQVTEPDPGRVIGGALQGNVRITGPNGLTIVGRNFVYSEKAMRLWSDESVHFAYGPHRGRGHGLQAELIADETATQHGSIAVTGVQSLRLRRNVAVDLVFGDDEAARRGIGAAKPAEKDPKKPPREPVEVRVRSTGSLEFDVEANVATFVDNVRAYRPTGDDHYDSLQCDQLTLMFEPDDVVKAAAAGTNAKADVDGGGDSIAEAPRSADASHTPVHRDVKDGQREGNFRNLDTRMTLRRVRARGKQVVLISESNDLTAHMTDLIYDVPTKVASLSNPEQVRVNQGSSELRSPGLTLMHDDQGKLTSVWCQGPGWLKHYDPDSRVLQLAAQWTHQLRQFADKETGLDVIELEKQALVRQPEQRMGLAAEFIRLWMQPQEVRAARGRGEKNTDRSSRMRLERMLAVKEVALVSPEMNGETDRLEVAFESAPAEAFPVRRSKTKPGSKPKPPATPDEKAASSIRSRESLQLANFAVPDEITKKESNHATDTPSESQPLPTPGLRSAGEMPAAPDPRNSPPVEGTPAPGETPRIRGNDFGPPEFKPPATAKPIVGGRRNSKAFSRATSPDAPAVAEMPKRQGKRSSDLQFGSDANDSPIQVLADVIRVRVLLGADQRQTHVAEVWTEGNVEVTQEHEDGEEPLIVTGDKMHVENRSEADQVLHVVGAPAHVRDRGVHIEGHNVHLDRKKNNSWVDGAGLLQLPVNSGLDGQKLESSQLLDVWWKERMTFDGLNARFFGDVRCVLNDSRMLCQEMEVELTSKISFSEQRGGREVKVQNIDCRDGVQFDSTEYLVSKLTEVRRGQVARFTLNQMTGKTTAHGPGWMTFWRRGNGRRAGLGSSSIAPAARTTSADSSQWEYTRVDFTGESDGNVQQRFTTFEERVQIVYGPVERPLATIDPDELPKDGGWMRCDKLRLQQHVLSNAKDVKGPKPTHVEVLGSGNAELEGRSFHARADTISFDESKGLYVLRSFGTNKATIWRQKQAGGEFSRADAQRMEFVPSRNQLKLDQTVGLDASE